MPCDVMVLRGRAPTIWLALAILGSIACQSQTHFATRLPEEWRDPTEREVEASFLSETTQDDSSELDETTAIRRSSSDPAFLLARDFVFAWKHGAAERYLSEAPELGAISGGRARPLLPTALAVSKSHLPSSDWTFHHPKADRLRATALLAAQASGEIIVTVEADSAGGFGPLYLGLVATKQGLRVSHLWTETGDLP